MERRRDPASRSFPIPTRLCYRLPGLTAREALRTHSLPSPHFTDRETEALGDQRDVKPRAQGHLTGEPVADSETCRLPGPRAIIPTRRGRD